MKSRSLGIGSFFLIVILLLGATIISVLNSNPIKEMDDLGEASDFTLPSIDSSNYTMSSDDGKVRVLTFAYTKCTEGCAIIVSKMNAVLRQLVEEQSNDRVKFITIDFDYANDNMTDMKNYASLFNDDTSQWQWLLGDKNQTDQVALDYSFFFEETNDTSTPILNHAGENHTVTYIHSFIVYIIDGNGHLRDILLGSVWENPELYNRVTFLIDELDV